MCLYRLTVTNLRFRRLTHLIRFFHRIADDEEAETQKLGRHKMGQNAANKMRKIKQTSAVIAFFFFAS